MTDNNGRHSRDSTQDRKSQTGSVIEFMFVDRGYLATSYPYPPTRERHEKRYIAKEGLSDDMEEFLEEENHVYIINASANAFNCWIFVYWTKLGEYDEHVGGEISKYPQITQRLNDFQIKNRGKVRSTAFGSGKETIFLRASNGRHQWSFRWNDLPFACEMMIQDSIQQSGWKDRRSTMDGKKLERIHYHGPDLVEEHDGATTSRRRDDDTNKRAPGCIRFLTLGRNDAWIVYGETWHIWDKSGNKLPKMLLKGLEMGRKYQWIINKVELSLFNEDEYVLVYDEGPIFYNILSSTFVNEFKKVVNQWADSKGVDVYYNENVVPEKIRSNRNVQKYLVPLKDDESATSHKTHPSSADETIPQYTEGILEPFPTIGDVNTIRNHETESPPQRTVSQGRRMTGATEPTPDIRQEESGGRASIPQRPPQNDPTNPAANHWRRSGDKSNMAAQEQRHRGGFVDTVRRRFHPDRTNP